MVTTRLIAPGDAEAVALLVSDNRDFLAPYEPLRDDAYFTVEGQRSDIDAALRAYQQGTGLHHVIIDEACAVIVRITLNVIFRGALQS